MLKGNIPKSGDCIDNETSDIIGGSPSGLLKEIKIIRKKTSDIYNIPKVERSDIALEIAMSISDSIVDAEYISETILDMLNSANNLLYPLYVKNQKELLLKYLLSYFIGNEDESNKYQQLVINKPINLINVNGILIRKATGQPFRVKSLNIYKSDEKLTIKISELDKLIGKGGKTYDTELINYIYNNNVYNSSTYKFISDIIFNKFYESNNNKYNNQSSIIKYDKNIELLLNKLSKLYDANFIINYDDLSMYNNIASIGAYTVLQNAIENGSDSDFVYNYIENEIVKRRQEDFYNKRNKLMTKNVFEFGQKRLIMKDKFSSTRYKKLEFIINYKNYVTFDSFAEDNLSDNEIKLVNTIFENKVNYWKSVTSNNCPHVKIYINFINSNDKSDYKALTNFIGKIPDIKKNPAFIQCKVCKFNLVCPHIIELYEYHNKNMKHSDIVDNMQKYFSDKSYNYNYYCKICGEDILGIRKVKSEATHAETEANSIGIKDELRSKIWGYFITLIKKHVIFNKLTSIYNLVNDMIETCYYYIQTDIVRLNKSTMDQKDIDKTLSIYIPIYGYIYLLQIMKQNNFNRDMIFRGLDRVKKGRNIVIKIMNVIMSYINYKIPKNKKKTYFQFMLNVNKDLSDKIGNIIMVDRKKLFITDMINTEVIYKYINSMVTTGSLPSKNPVKELEYILKINMKKLPKDLNVFDKKRIHQIDNTKFKKLCNPPEYLKNSSINYSQFLLNCYDNFLNIINGVSSTNHNGDSSIYSIQESILALRYLYYYKNYVVNFMESSVIPPYQITYSEVYNNNGKKYNWNYYLYSVDSSVNNSNNVKSNKIVALTKKEIGILRKDMSRPMKYYKFIGMKSLNGTVQSEIKKSNDVLKVIKDNYIFNNLFIFYEIQCPVSSRESNIHNFDKNNKCNKCGLIAGEQSVEYFKKYEKQYLELYSSLSENKYIIKPNKVQIIPNDNKIDQWDFPAKILDNLSNEFNINKNIVYSLGNTEFHDFSLILKGNIPKYSPENKFNHRIVKLHSYLLTILINYNSLKNYNEYLTNNNNIKRFIKNNLKEIDFPIYKLNDLKKLPDIHMDKQNNKSYIDVYYYMMGNTKKYNNLSELPIRITNYLIYSIYSVLESLKNIKISDNDIKKLIDTFIIFSIDYIKYSEEVTATISKFVLDEENITRITELNSSFDDDEFVGKKTDVYDVDDTDFRVDNDFSNMDYTGHNEDDDPDID